MTRLAIASLTAANESGDRARAALRAFLTTTNELEAERIHAAAIIERAAAEDAATDAYDDHRIKGLALADYEGANSALGYEVSVWYDAHCAWQRAAKAWDQIPDAWES